MRHPGSHERAASWARFGPAARSGAVAGSVGLAVTLTLAARYGWHHFIDYDARFFRAVALDLTAAEAVAGDSAYRYGRIGLPLVGRGLALGSTGEALDAALMLVTPLATGLLVAAAVAIAVRVSGRWTDGLVVLLVPGLVVGFAYAWADTLLAALVVGSIWATLMRRHALCAAVLAGAVLTKEVGVLAVLPAVLATARDRDGRGSLARLASLLPAVAWWSWVRIRSGEWPFLADDPARARALSAPLADVLDALLGGPGDPLAALLALIIGVAGIALFIEHRNDVLAWSAGVWGGLALCLGDNVLRYPGDAIRVLTPSMCVVALAARLLQRQAEVLHADDVVIR